MADTHRSAPAGNGVALINDRLAVAQRQVFVDASRPGLQVERRVQAGMAFGLLEGAHDVAAAFESRAEASPDPVHGAALSAVPSTLRIPLAARAWGDRLFPKVAVDDRHVRVRLVERCQVRVVVPQVGARRAHVRDEFARVAAVQSCPEPRLPWLTATPALNERLPPIAQDGFWRLS